MNLIILFLFALEGSAFMLGRALTSVAWGIIADKYGRKPVIIVGTFAVFVSGLLFSFLSFQDLISFSVLLVVVIQYKYCPDLN